MKVNARLKKLLPPLTDEEREQLEKNILEAETVRDAIVYAKINGNDIVIDGMNRLAIAEKHDVEYFTTLEASVTTLAEAELWILNNQLGRRNLLKPAALRKVRGDLYNKLKGGPGGAGKNRGQNVPSSNAAKNVSQQAGVDEKTAKRDGKFAEAANSLAKPLRNAILNSEPEKIGLKKQPTDEEVKQLSQFDADSQIKIVREVRIGNEPSLKDSLKAQGCKFQGRSTASGKAAGSKSGGGSKKDPLATQRSKTVKTVEALMRAFDDLNELKSKAHEHAESIASCKILLKTAKEWK